MKQGVVCMCIWILSGYEELVSINTLIGIYYMKRIYALNQHFVYIKYVFVVQLLHMSTAAIKGSSHRHFKCHMSITASARFSFYYCCCSVTQLCPWDLTLCDPMACRTPGLPVPHHVLEFPCNLLKLKEDSTIKQVHVVEELGETAIDLISFFPHNSHLRH